MWLNYDDMYAVSDDGGLIMNRNTGLILKPSIYKIGYPYVCIHGKTRYVHHLVADRFLPRIDLPNLQIDHIDGDKANNSASNLRWCSRSVNNRNKSLSKNISYSKDRECWAVCFQKHRKAIFCKQFKTLEEATAARDAFKVSEEYRLSM